MNLRAFGSQDYYKIFPFWHTIAGKKSCWTILLTSTCFHVFSD
uniref:Uncharacterized protein n=1 Tax=Rhizophora mucronata TaxID=61149 RepID=A0A2P2K1S0_RHIMU